MSDAAVGSLAFCGGLILVALFIWPGLVIAARDGVHRLGMRVIAELSGEARAYRKRP